MFKRKQPRNQLPYNELVPAFYCRVSSDEQADKSNISLPDQQRETQDFARRLGMPIYNEYILLEDEKGTLIDRPQLIMLRQWIREGRINAVIVRTTDRFSKNNRIGEELFDEMVQYGVRFFVVMHGREFDISEDSFEREMLIEEMKRAKYWLKMLSFNMVSGRRSRIVSGNPAHGGSARYGWTRWKDDHKQWHYEIAPEEATVIQSIFHQFIQGVGTIKIQKYLKGKPTPAETRIDPEKLHKVKKATSGQWSLGTIYSILRDETYTGKLTLYKESDEYEPVVIPIPAIITEDTLYKAQAILDKGKKDSPRSKKQNENFLLARRMTCVCGATMHTHPTKKRDGSGYYYYYSCRRSHNRKGYVDPTCNAPQKTWDSAKIDNTL